MTNIICDLEAHNPERNAHRFYRVWTTKNLFNVMLVCTQYGRVGTYGRTKEYVVSSVEEANKMISSIMQRRRGSVRRIGVPYKGNKM